MSIKTKKLIPYFLTLIVLIGFFGLVPMMKVHAQSASLGSTQTTQPSTVDIVNNPTGSTNNSASSTPVVIPFATDSVIPTTDASGQSPASAVQPQNSNILNNTTVMPTEGGMGALNNSTGQTAVSQVQPTPPPIPSNYVDAMTKDACVTIGDGSVPGCVKLFFYYVFYSPAAVILTMAAKFFNALVAISLFSTLTASSTFIPTAWTVVRDLSNLFFILILLYIAITLILDIGGHDAKKMIAKVIIIALLINFSMFFTEVIIDSSNILALIFYNKLQVNTPNPDGTPSNALASTNGETGPSQKDLSGGMYNTFDVTQKLDQSFWQKTLVPIAGMTESNYQGKNQASANDIPAGTAVGVTLVAVSIMLFAAYAFFISGLAFVGRLLELWILIIFSPFAFMSSTVPLFAGVEYIGWSDWIKRLFKTAFMASIFMFFLYLIFLLLGKNTFNGFILNPTATATPWYATLLSSMLPGVLTMILLLKATDYAKKGSGVIGEKLAEGGKMITGWAMGAAMGGVALAGNKFVGGHYQKVANDDDLRKKAADGDKDAIRKLNRANYMASKSFDFRQTGLGKLAAKKSGFDFEAGTGAMGIGTEKLKGGAAAGFKRKTEKDEAIRKSYEMTPAAAAKQDKEAAEVKKQNKEGKEATDKQNARAGEYEKDKEEAKKITIRQGGPMFNEKAFKEAYEKGGRLDILAKNVEAGPVEKVADFKEAKVQTSKDVNLDRREAQVWHMEHPTSGQDENGREIKAGFKDFGRLFKEGVKDMTASKAGQATLAAGVGFAPMTFGASLVAAPFLGGVLHAVKTIAKAKVLDEDSKIHDAAVATGIHKLVAPDPNQAAILRKELSASQKIVNILKDIEGVDKKEVAKLDNVISPSSIPAGSAKGSGPMNPPGPIVK